MIWALSTLLFVGISTTVSLFLCFFLGSLTKGASIFSLSLGFFLALATFIKLKDRISPLKKLSYFDWAMVLFFVVFCFRHFLWLIFQVGNSIMALDPSNWGELPKHIAYANYLARGAKFWPEHPLLTGVPFTYHFGIDLFSAMFSHLGFSFVDYMPVMGFIAGLILIVTLLAWGAGFALGAFLFAGGGLGYSYFFTRDLHDYQAGKAWTSIVMYLFATQRGFLYALPAGLLLLWSWRRRFFSQDLDSQKKPLPFIIEGVLWGTMPLFQIQTFLFLSLTFAFWFLTTKKYKTIFIFFVAFLPATIEVFLISDHFSKASFIWWNPGWMAKSENLILFFWGNYGLYLPLAISTFILALKIPLRKERPYVWKQMAPAVFLFVACFFVTFQPWDWDNIKYMMWCYILLLPLVYEYVICRLSITARILGIGALFIPGFLAVLSMHNPKNRGIEIYGRETVDAVCTALKSVDANRRIATAKIHNHPAMICGQPVVVGYTGVLWGEGLKYTETEQLLTQMMHGDSNWRTLAHQLKARYLFWGPSEVSEYAGSSKPWEHENVKVLAQGAWGKIYDLGDL